MCSHIIVCHMNGLFYTICYAGIEESFHKKYKHLVDYITSLKMEIQKLKKSVPECMCAVNVIQMHRT